MPTAGFSRAKSVVRRALEGLGYQRAYLRNGYSFADLLADSPTTFSVPMAAFTGRPFTYATAAVALIDSHDPPAAARSLGAPLVFQFRDQSLVHWRVSEDDAAPIAQIPLDGFERYATRHHDLWSPDAISRTKSARFQLSPRQLDFVDAGLLPTIDAEARRKLDWILNRVVATARAVLSEHLAESRVGSLEESISQLVFRFVAAKLLMDRGDMPHLAHAPARAVSGLVQEKYFGRSSLSELPGIAEAESAVWNELRGAFSFANLSVDTLAHIYENTLVPDSVRRARGVHGTPPEVARYVMARLPVEELELHERLVFEPFAGHAVFLVAALARLRELAPATWTPRQEHAYLKKMLVGMEVDPFAVEVARLSLMLADYPNPDGWNLITADAFDGESLVEFSRSSSITVANPPFEEFERAERAQYAALRGTGKAQEALTRVLEGAPAMLGFIMPRAFVSARHYREQRRELAQTYGAIEVVELPDNVFAHAGAESVVLTAWARKTTTLHVSYGSVSKSQLPDFLQFGRFARTEADIELTDLEPDYDLRLPELAQVWSELRHHDRLGDVAAIHRGVEWKTEQATRTSDESRPGSTLGLLKAPRGLPQYVPPEPQYLDLSPDLMRRNALSYPWGQPKVVLNAVRRSRGPWKVAAFVDRSGLVVSQNFTAIWPDAGYSLEVVAAILNGPVANAFLTMRVPGRHLEIRFLKQIPLPRLTPSIVSSIESKVMRYLEQVDEAARSQLLLDIDAEVLAAYDLSPRAERELLRHFDGTSRPGVQGFDGYPGAGVDAALPLRVLLKAPRLSRERLPDLLPRVREPRLRKVLASLR